MRYIDALERASNILKRLYEGKSELVNDVTETLDTLVVKLEWEPYEDD